MPWSHCGHHDIDDDETCPACGRKKGKWSVRLDKTRVLSLGSRRVKSWIELELLDLAGEPVADARYTCTYSDGTSREGVLDEQGIQRIRKLIPGIVKIGFPDHDLTGELELTEAFCEGRHGERHTFQLGHWIEIRLEHADGEPAQEEPFRLEFPAEEEAAPIEGKLDARGFARVGGLPNGGVCTVVFPRRLVPATRIAEPALIDGEPVEAE